MRKHIILNGHGTTGKDELARYIVEYCNELEIDAKVISSVEDVKSAAILLGWGGQKDDNGRKFLSALKDISTEFYNAPMKSMIESAKGVELAIFMIREPQEIEKFVKMNPDTLTILVERTVEVEFDNHSDKNVADYAYDLIVDNNGTLEELKDSAETIINSFVITTH